MAKGLGGEIICKFISKKFKQVIADYNEVSGCKQKLLFKTCFKIIIFILGL